MSMNRSEDSYINMASFLIEKIKVSHEKDAKALQPTGMGRLQTPIHKGDLNDSHSMKQKHVKVS